jgi:hypothetical protein
MSKPDGGPAFPRYGNDERHGASALCQDGMSLRDYFAGQALVGWIAGRWWDVPDINHSIPREHTGYRGAMQDLAVACYEQADAMLKERETP